MDFGHRVENKGAPLLAGWAIAAAAALVALVAVLVVGEQRPMIAAFVAALVFAGVGLVLGIDWGAEVPAPAPAPEAEPAPAPAEAPAAIVAPPAAAPAPAVAEAAVVEAAAAKGTAPLRLAAPRGGVADDLKEIEGIGPALEKLCNELGFWHWDQIAGWSEAEIDWVDAHMKNFKGRIRRDKWVAQARLILAEGVEAFRIRARTNDY
jgi:predicted flap endonuclease-1-like 5' DNA nuclease